MRSRPSVPTGGDGYLVIGICKANHLRYAERFAASSPREAQIMALMYCLAFGPCSDLEIAAVMDPAASQIVDEEAFTYEVILRPHSAALESVLAVTRARLADEENELSAYCEWLEQTLRNFRKNIDGVRNQELTEAPGDISFTDSRGLSFTFRPSHALAQIVAAARRVAPLICDADALSQAQAFVDIFANALDCMFSAVATPHPSAERHSGSKNRSG